MILDRDDAAGGAGSLFDRVFIQRLDRRYMQNEGVDPGGQERRHSGQDATRLETGADDRHIGTVAHCHGPPELEAIRIIEQDRAAPPPKTDVHGTREGDGPPYDLPRLELVRWDDDRHTGHRAHHCHVVEALVRLPCQTGKDTGRLTNEADRQARLRDEDADLVVGPVDLEARVRAEERDVAHGGETGGDADHVLLRDSHLEEPIRVRSGEHQLRGGRRIVCVEENDVGILTGELDERTVEGLT